MTQMQPNSDDIRFEQKNRAGFITLNRPEALNAVTDGMLSALSAQLDVWEHDASVERVVIKAVPGRAFSAGGDIRHLYDCGVAGDFDFAFFAREYALNARIARFSKPYIALVDGIAMGGGVGVSFHGSHRIGGDRMAFAMPEVGIGFFPDIGGSYLLSRLPGRLGLYLGLTGERVKRDDALWSGLITHSVKSSDYEQLEERLSTSSSLDNALEGLTTGDDIGSNEDGPLQALLPWIDEAFEEANVEVILERLNAMEGEAGDKGAWASKTRTTLQQKSPTSLKIAARQIEAGANLSIEGCMRMEYRILKRILPGPDFYEGIRAAIIDKDGQPAWTPDAIDAVSDAVIDGYFAPLPPEHELTLP
ncbi:MAG: enoyl-CoA hydratase/isomerase family protein [Pseudomonadota bacterium]